MIRNDSCCEPACKTKEYSKAVQIVCRTLEDLFWKIRDIDWKDAQEAALMKVFTSLWKITDVPTLAEKVLENEKNIKVAEIKADEADPECEEWDMKWIMWLWMFENLDDWEAE